MSCVLGLCLIFYIKSLRFLICRLWMSVAHFNTWHRRPLEPPAYSSQMEPVPLWVIIWTRSLRIWSWTSPPPPWDPSPSSAHHRPTRKAGCPRCTPSAGNPGRTPGPPAGAASSRSSVPTTATRPDRAVCSGTEPNEDGHETGLTQTCTAAGLTVHLQLRCCPSWCRSVVHASPSCLQTWKGGRKWMCSPKHKWTGPVSGTLNGRFWVGIRWTCRRRVPGRSEWHLARMGMQQYIDWDQKSTSKREGVILFFDAKMYPHANRHSPSLKRNMRQLDFLFTKDIQSQLTRSYQ